MNNHESFFSYPKKRSQSVRCKSKPLDGTPQCAFHRFCLAATRLPHSPPPKKASSYRGCRSSKTGSPSRESRSPTPSAMAVSCMGRSRATDILSILPPILTGSPVSLIPAWSVLPAMSPGSAWEEAQPECFAPGGLGEMTEGKAAPPSPLRRPAEGVQGLEQAMARHAEDCDRAGGCRRIHAKRRALSHLACFLAVMPSCPILR